MDSVKAGCRILSMGDLMCRHDMDSHSVAQDRQNIYNLLCCFLGLPSAAPFPASHVCLAERSFHPMDTAFITQPLRTILLFCHGYIYLATVRSPATLPISLLIFLETLPSSRSVLNALSKNEMRPTFSTYSPFLIYLNSCF